MLLDVVLLPTIGWLDGLYHVPPRSTNPESPSSKLNEVALQTSNVPSTPALDASNTLTVAIVVSAVHAV